MKLFHITPKRNVVSIFSQGLRINPERRGLTVRQNHWIRAYGCSPIFLCQDPEWILVTQANPSWILQHDPIVLHVDVSGLRIEPEYAYLLDPVRTHLNSTSMRRDDLETKTYVCFDDISPKRIVLSTDCHERVDTKLSSNHPDDIA